MEDVYSLFAAARAAATEGDKEKAEQLYRRVIEEYPDSFEATAAAREIGTVAEGGSAPSPQSPPQEDYTAARGISMLISGLGWLTVVGAILLGLAGASEAPASTIPLIAGFALTSVIGGLLMVVTGQATRALVDMANNVASIQAQITSQGGK